MDSRVALFVLWWCLLDGAAAQYSGVTKDADALQNPLSVSVLSSVYTTSLSVTAPTITISDTTVGALTIVSPTNGCVIAVALVHVTITHGLTLPTTLCTGAQLYVIDSSITAPDASLIVSASLVNASLVFQRCQLSGYGLQFSAAGGGTLHVSRSVIRFQAVQFVNATLDLEAVTFEAGSVLELADSTTFTGASTSSYAIVLRSSSFSASTFNMSSTLIAQTAVNAQLYLESITIENSTLSLLNTTISIPQHSTGALTVVSSVITGTNVTLELAFVDLVGGTCDQASTTTTTGLSVSASLYRGSAVNATVLQQDTAIACAAMSWTITFYDNAPQLFIRIREGSVMGPISVQTTPGDGSAASFIATNANLSSVSWQSPQTSRFAVLGSTLRGRIVATGLLLQNSSTVLFTANRFVDTLLLTGSLTDSASVALMQNVFSYLSTTLTNRPVVIQMSMLNAGTSVQLLQNEIRGANVTEGYDSVCAITFNNFDIKGGLLLVNDARYDFGGVCVENPTVTYPANITVVSPRTTDAVAPLRYYIHGNFVSGAVNVVMDNATVDDVYLDAGSGYAAVVMRVMNSRLNNGGVNLRAAYNVSELSIMGNEINGTLHCEGLKGNAASIDISDNAFKMWTPTDPQLAIVFISGLEWSASRFALSSNTIGTTAGGPESRALYINSLVARDSVVQIESNAFRSNATISVDLDVHGAKSALTLELSRVVGSSVSITRHFTSSEVFPSSVTVSNSLMSDFTLNGDSTDVAFDTVSVTGVNITNSASLSGFAAGSLTFRLSMFGGGLQLRHVTAIQGLQILNNSFLDGPVQLTSLSCTQDNFYFAAMHNTMSRVGGVLPSGGMWWDIETVQFGANATFIMRDVAYSAGDLHIDVSVSNSSRAQIDLPPGLHGAVALTLFDSSYSDPVQTLTSVTAGTRSNFTSFSLVCNNPNRFAFSTIHLMDSIASGSVTVKGVMSTPTGGALFTMQSIYFASALAVSTASWTHGSFNVTGCTFGSTVSLTSSTFANASVTFTDNVFSALLSTPTAILVIDNVELDDSVLWMAEQAFATTGSPATLYLHPTLTGPRSQFHAVMPQRVSGGLGLDIALQNGDSALSTAQLRIAGGTYAGIKVTAPSTVSLKQVTIVGAQVSGDVRINGGMCTDGATIEISDCTLYGGSLDVGNMKWLGVQPNELTVTSNRFLGGTMSLHHVAMDDLQTTSIVSNYTRVVLVEDNEFNQFGNANPTVFTSFQLDTVTFYQTFFGVQRNTLRNVSAALASPWALISFSNVPLSAGILSIEDNVIALDAATAVLINSAGLTSNTSMLRVSIGTNCAHPTYGGFAFSLQCAGYDTAGLFNSSFAVGRYANVTQPASVAFGSSCVADIQLQHFSIDGTSFAPGTSLSVSGTRAVTVSILNLVLHDATVFVLSHIYATGAQALFILDNITLTEFNATVAPWLSLDVVIQPTGTSRGSLLITNVSVHRADFQAPNPTFPLIDLRVSTLSDWPQQVTSNTDIYVGNVTIVESTAVDPSYDNLRMLHVENSHVVNCSVKVFGCVGCSVKAHLDQADDSNVSIALRPALQGQYSPDLDVQIRSNTNTALLHVFASSDAPQRAVGQLTLSSTSADVGLVLDVANVTVTGVSVDGSFDIITVAIRNVTLLSKTSFTAATNCAGCFILMDRISVLPSPRDESCTRAIAFDTVLVNATAVVSNTVALSHDSNLAGIGSNTRSTNTSWYIVNVSWTSTGGCSGVSTQSCVGDACSLKVARVSILNTSTGLGLSLGAARHFALLAATTDASVVLPKTEDQTINDCTLVAEGVTLGDAPATDDNVVSTLMCVRDYTTGNDISGAIGTTMSILGVACPAGSRVGTLSTKTNNLLAQMDDEIAAAERLATERLVKAAVAEVPVVRPHTSSPNLCVAARTSSESMSASLTASLVAVVRRHHTATVARRRSSKSVPRVRGLRSLTKTLIALHEGNSSTAASTKVPVSRLTPQPTTSTSPAPRVADAIINTTSALAASQTVSSATTTTTTVASAAAALSFAGEGGASATSLQSGMLLLTCGGTPSAVVPFTLGDGPMGSLAAIFSIWMVAAAVGLAAVALLVATGKEPSLLMAANRASMPGALLSIVGILYQGWCYAAAQAVITDGQGGATNAAGLAALLFAVLVPVVCGVWQRRVLPTKRVVFIDYAPVYKQLSTSSILTTAVLPMGRWDDAATVVPRDRVHKLLGPAYNSFRSGLGLWTVLIGRIEPFTIAVMLAMAAKGSITCDTTRIVGVVIMALSAVIVILTSPARMRLCNAAWPLSNIVSATAAAIVAAGRPLSDAEVVLSFAAALSVGVTVSTTIVRLLEGRYRSASKKLSTITTPVLTMPTRASNAVPLLQASPGAPVTASAATVAMSPPQEPSSSLPPPPPPIRHRFSNRANPLLQL